MSERGIIWDSHDNADCKKALEGNFREILGLFVPK